MKRAPMSLISGGRTSSAIVFLLSLGSCFTDYALARGTVALPTVMIPAEQEDAGAKRSIRLEDLVGLRDVVGLALSPDGKYVAASVQQADLAVNDYKTGLWLIETTSGGRRINLGSIGPVRYRPNGESIRAAPHWSPDNKHIVIVQSVEGTAQLCAIDVKTLNSIVLTREAGDVASFEFVDADTIHYLVDQPAFGTNESKAAWQKIYAQGVLLDRPLRAPYWGGPLVDKAYTSRHPAIPVVKAVSLRARTVRQLTPVELQRRQGVLPGADALAPERFSMGAASRTRSMRLDPDTGAYAYSQYELDAGTLARHDLYVHAPNQATGKLVKSFRSNSPRLLGWRRQHLYYAHLDKGIWRIHRVEWPSLKVEQLPGSWPGMSELSISEDGERAVFVREGPTHPGVIVMRDLRNGQERTLLELNPEFRSVQFTDYRRMEWKNQWGNEGHAYLVYPAGYVPGNAYPLVVTTYRANGFLRGATGDEYPIHYLAAQGIAVLAFDIGPSHFRRRGSELTQTLRWLGPTDGLRQLLQQLDRMGIIDPNRRAVCGLSFGTDLATYWISHTDWFVTAISSGGSYDPGHSSMLGVPHPESAYGGDQLIPGNPILDSLEEWKKISPAMNVERVSASLLFNVADSEVLTSTMMVQAMNQREKAVEMWIFPDSLHVKHQPQHRWTLYNRNVDWFRFWLQGHEDQSLEKGAQYARWRTLRERRAADVKKQQDAGTTPTSLRGLAAPLALVEVAGRPRSCAAQTASRCRNRVRAVPTS